MPTITIRMRSSEAVPTSFVRPKLHERHHNSIQPLWMRVLEEKYQKLQLKIAQSTATMNGLYSSTLGRTIYDSKLVRASLQKPKELQQNGIRRNGKFDIKSRISATQISSNPGIQKHSIHIGNAIHRTNIHYDKEQNVDDRLHGDDKSVNQADIERKIKDRGTKVSEILCLRYDKNGRYKKEMPDFRRKNVQTSSQNNSGNSMQNVEVSSSRQSFSTLQTVRSCPVNNVIDSVQNNEPRTESASKSKINRRKMKMFSRMSAEAQTALTETIMENNSERNIDSDTEDVPQDDMDPGDDAVFGPDCVVSLGDINSNSNRQNNCNDSEVSMASRDSRSIHTRLPEIANESEEYLTLRNVRKVDCRVPGVGTFPYTTKRETTFEITPPGFDIRYKDAPIREERESETPPPDIRDRAIRKCQDWLTRYTPRTPRPSQTSN